jgi:exodeoxyribonuclease-1
VPCNNLIFYDTETSGINKDYSQILQCGSIRTNASFETLETHNTHSFPLPWVIPQPRAMLTNKKTFVFKANTSHYEMMLDIHRQWRQWTIDEPAIFITYNGHSFDEELIRRQFYWNLLDIYLTNTNGNGRLDMLLMMHALACFVPSALKIPLFEEGPNISLKLEDISKENGLNTDDAHDAIADCQFMVDLLKKIQANNSDLVSYFLSTSTKAGIQEKLQQDGFFGLAEVFKRQKFQWPVVPCGSDLERPNYVALFDLGHDPDDIFDLDTSDIYKMIQSSSKDNPIKKCQINKTIPLCTSNLIEDKNIFDIDFDLLEERATKVRENLDFQQTVSQALTDRLFNSREPNTIEESIYAGGFPSPADKSLMDDFHRYASAEERIKIARNIQDDRFRLFAERLICQIYPADAPQDMLSRYQELIASRLSEDGPWGSIAKSSLEIEKLLEELSSKEEQSILKDTQAHLNSLG